MIETTLDQAKLSPLSWAPHLRDSQSCAVNEKKTKTQAGRTSQEA